ncbi:MAG TPA: penicillin-binding transpeptidase domain-containing protein [Bacteroidota bacterium]|nr:penicillin-binding transpeptidase domain-containing protein [Bacteroidota bacterium]
MAPNVPIAPTTLPQPGQNLLSGRLFFLKFVLVVAFVAIAGRLVKIQILDGPKFQAVAKKQYEQKFILPPVRGNIYDRSGNILVSNTMFVSFAADPKIIGDNVDRVALHFSKIFGKPASHYAAKLRNTEEGRRFVWLERRIRPDIARRLEVQKLEGVVVVNEPKRLYHYDDLAGALIGFTDIDNKGISGVELSCDDDLSGTSGSMTMQRDGLGRTRPSADYPTIAPIDGHHVSLTIDLSYQAIVEEELKKGVTANKADGGLAVMLNPKTGEILALSTYPGVNPNEVSKYDVRTARNRIVTDMFEPGSVFKIVTASAAYEHNLIPPEKRFNAENGIYKVALRGGKFRTITDSHKHDVLTFQEAMEQSSNIVMAKAGNIIGPENLYRQARDFGFGIPTGVDLAGEVRGRLKKPHQWSGTTLQTLAYGYEVAVTPLQIAAAYAAVANNGELMKPFVIAQVVDADGNRIREQLPQRIRQVVSNETASLLSKALEGVVERGTASEVRINGVRIAGKTGTARRIIDGKYEAGYYTASFVGFFPVEDPQVVCLVMMDNPRSRGYYGGSTSGPIFHAIAERVVHTSWKFSRPAASPSGTEEKETTTVPDVRNVQKAIAGKILEGRGLKGQMFGNGDVVVRQSPDPGAIAEKGDVIRLALNDEPVTDTKGLVAVPDVRKMTIRRAINRLVIDDFDIEVQGSGLVVNQYPPSGQKAMAGSKVRLVCEPPPISTAVLY